MDESEKRRERLKAMRNEAAQGEALSANQPQVYGFQSGLANPLTDASPLQEVPRSAPRFDYYTDPLASFSANRRGHVDSHVPHPRGFVPNPGHVRPFPLRQMPPPPPEQWNPMMNFRPHPGPRAYQGGGGPFSGSFPYRAPVGSEKNPYIPHQEFPPGVGNHSSSPVSYHPRPHFPRGANFPNSGGHSGMRDVSSGQGRGRSFHGPYSGRGRGNWSEKKERMGSEQSSSRNLGSASQMAKSLYEKYMVDDPWKSLEPSVCREEKAEISPTSSMKVGVKRPLEISGPSISNSQSLAEYLADSFDEAVKGVTLGEKAHGQSIWNKAKQAREVITDSVSEPIYLSTSS